MKALSLLDAVAGAASTLLLIQVLFAVSAKWPRRGWYAFTFAAGVFGCLVAGVTVTALVRFWFPSTA
jgi:hypothetical protein